MKLEKIILFNHSQTPDVIKRLLKNHRKSKNAKSLNTDSALITKIENLAETNEEKISDELIRNNPDKLYHIETPLLDIYTGYCTHTTSPACLYIRTYDASQKWILEEYDGQQSIRKMEFKDIGNNIFEYTS